MIKGKITFSRPHYGHHDKKVVKIEIEDTDAVCNFLTVEMALEDFAAAVTGLSFQPCEITPRNLSVVGKRRETIPLEFKIPGPKYKTPDETVRELARKATPDGWVCSEYFGSQNSFFTRDGDTYARTTAHRWVKKEYTDK